MYKDKDKQKEANRLAAKRRRDKAKGMTIEEGMTPKGVTKSGYDSQGMTKYEPDTEWMNAPLGPMPRAAGFPPPNQRDFAPRTNPDSLNYGAYLNSDQLKQAGLTANRVPIPGDSGYSGCCELIDDKWVVRQGAA